MGQTDASLENWSLEMSILKGVGLQFEESMSGYLGKGETIPAKELRGETPGNQNPV